MVLAQHARVHPAAQPLQEAGRSLYTVNTLVSVPVGRLAMMRPP